MPLFKHFVTLCIILVPCGWTISPCLGYTSTVLELGTSYVWSNTIPGSNVSNVDFVINSTGYNRVLNCTMANLLCVPQSSRMLATVELNGDHITANLSISSLMTDVYVCMIVDLKEMEKKCLQIVVFAPPNGLNCTLNYTASSPVVVTCTVEKVFPAAIQCTLYRRVNQVKNLGNVTGTGTLESSGYYSSNCSFTTSDIIGTDVNRFYVNVKNPLQPASQGLNSDDLLFNQSDTLVLVEAGKPYTLTNTVDYISASTLDWVIITTNTIVVVTNCSAPTFSCSSATNQVTVVSVGSLVRSNFTFNVTTDITSVCMLVNRQNTVRYCRNFTVYASAESVNCTVGYGLDNVTINCQAEKMFPGQIVCTFFRTLQVVGQNSTDKLLGTASGSGTLQSGYYRSSCSLLTYDVSWGLNQYFANVRNPLAPTGESRNSSVVNFNATNVILSGFNIGISSGYLQCQTKPAPAQIIRITRKGLGTEVAVSYNTSLLTYPIANFSCDYLDEYICEANEVKTGYILTKTCTPRLVETLKNETYSCKLGGTVLLPPIVISSTNQPNEFTLLYSEGGVTYQARPEMFRAYYMARSLYFGTVNLAIYGLTEGDYRSYVFYIRSWSVEGATVYFTLNRESTDDADYKSAVIALGILFAISAIVVAVFIAVYLCYRCRGQGRRQERSQAVPMTFSKPVPREAGDFYDSMNGPDTENQNYYGQVAGASSSTQAQDGIYVNTKAKPEINPKIWKKEEPEIYGNAEPIRKHNLSMKQK